MAIKQGISIRETKMNKNIDLTKIMKQTIEIEVPDGKKAVWKDNKVMFEDIEPQLPKTWEDFIEIKKLKYQSAGCFVEEIPKGLIDSYPTLNQIVAVLKLKKLRDYYNNNWHCDYRNENEKNVVIIRSHGELKIFVEWTITTFLTFKSTEIAKEFLTNFRELIEQAGDLI